MLGDLRRRLLQAHRLDDAGQLVHEHDRSEARRLEDRRQRAGDRRVEDGGRRPLCVQPLRQRAGGDGGIVGFPQAVDGREPLEPLDQQTLAEGRDVHLHAGRLRQTLHLGERVELRAVGMGVVQHVDDAAGPWCGRARLQGRPGRLQPGEAVLPVRLQVRALSPFVPGVHEHEPPVGVGDAPFRVRDGVGQPAPVAGRRGADPHGGGGAPPRRVVPARIDGSEERVGRLGVTLAAGREHGPVVDAAPEVRVQARHRRRDVGHAGQVRRKLDGRVEPDLRRIDHVERLRVG